MALLRPGQEELLLERSIEDILLRTCERKGLSGRASLFPVPGGQRSPDGRRQRMEVLRVTVAKPQGLKPAHVAQDVPKD